MLDHKDFIVKICFKKTSVRLLCVWAGLMLVLFVVHVSCVLPTEKHARRLALRLSDARRRLDKAMHYAEHENVQLLMSSAKARRDRLLHFVTETDIAADCGFAVNTIAEQMKISDFTSRYYTGKATASIPNCEHISKTQMNLSWQGTFPQFLHMINRLERHNPVVFVDSFSMVPVENMPGLHEIDLYLQMLILDVSEQTYENEKLGVVSIAK